MKRVSQFIFAALAVISMAPVFISTLSAQNDYFKGSRQVLINDGWRYLEDPSEDLAGLSGSSASWSSVNLPHTWNAFDVVDPVPGYRRNAGWYEKRLFVPASAKGSRLILYFEGVNIQSRIFVNGRLAGAHTGGYLGFEVDITGFVTLDAENRIDIRVDNSINRDIIPSQKSDFFIYGGITRNVWLKTVPLQYLSGVRIRTTEVSSSSAKTSVTLSIANRAGKETVCMIAASIKEASGKKILNLNLEKPVAGGDNIVEIKFPDLPNPALWSPGAPNLYTLEVRLIGDNGALDSVSEKFGYRWFEFKEHGAFYINGERLLLRGTQRHEEHAGLGGALPDSLQRKDIELAKEMGSNFIRLGHYPQAPEVYRACDELGIIVWDELPWCRGGIGGEAWKENTMRILRELIAQNFNHPSILIWSLGNELYWEPDFPDGGNNDSLRAFLSSLNAEAHALDPGRVTSIRKYYEGADITDLFSPSIWSGWYSGAYFDYEKTITEARDKYKRMFHAEYGGDSHVGRHSDYPVTGDGYQITNGKDTVKTKIKNISLASDWSENYIVNLFDWYLHVSGKLDWFTGSAQWILKDFGTPLRPENPIPYVNQKGLLDRAGNPKDAYYVYKSYWTSDPKFCYIESHTWTERGGPAGVNRTVKVYSNCDEVEFLLNGVSEGRRRRDTSIYPACGLSWNVSFREGKNDLRAVGYSGGKRIALDSMNVDYTYSKIESADHLNLFYSRLDNDNILITAIAADKNERRNFDYNKRVYFTAEGPGRLLENYGTPTRSSIIEMASGKAQIEFNPGRSGSTVIEARNQDFRGAYLKIDNKHFETGKE